MMFSNIVGVTALFFYIEHEKAWRDFANGWRVYGLVYNHNVEENYNKQEAISM